MKFNASKQQNPEDLQLMEKLMDAKDYVPVRKSQSCFICHCSLLNQSGTTKELEATCSIQPLEVQSMMCDKCRQMVIDENNRRASEHFNVDLFQGPDQISPLIESVSLPNFINEMSCNCDSCKERRRIQEEHEQEMATLQKLWIDLRNLLRSVFHRELVAQSSPTEGQKQTEMTEEDVCQAKELVERLCAYDPHELYEQIESSGCEFMVECKSRLANNCPSPPLSDDLSNDNKSASASIERVGRFVGALLGEYDTVKRICRKLSVLVEELERTHLVRFKLTIELNFRHLFHRFIYAELQKYLTDIAVKLRELSEMSISHDIKTSDGSFFAQLLHRFLKFDDEMTKVAADWRECCQLIEQYSDEQLTVKAKEKMMQENFESFQTNHRFYDHHQNVVNGSNHSVCQCDGCHVGDAGGMNKQSGNYGIEQSQIFAYYSAHQQFGISGAGDSTSAQLLTPYLASFKQCDIPYFDEPDEYSDQCSPSEPPTSPQWKDHRLVEGQDSLSRGCDDSNQMNSSSVDSGMRCDGSDDIDNDDADDEEDDSDSSCDESKFMSAWLPATQQHPPINQHLHHHCSCSRCNDQQSQLPLTTSSPSVPFLLHPHTLSALAMQQQQNAAGDPATGMVTPATVLGVLQPASVNFSPVTQQPQAVLLPQLYQIHCQSPNVLQNQRCSGDGSAVIQGLNSQASGSFGKLDLGTTCTWQQVYRPSCTTGTFTGSVIGSTMATWPSLASISPVHQGSIAMTSVSTVSPGSTVWRMPPSAVNHCPTATAIFSAPSPPFVRATGNQPVAYSFQQIAPQPSAVGLQFAGLTDQAVTAGGFISSVNGASKSTVNSFGIVTSSFDAGSVAVTPQCLSVTSLSNPVSTAAVSTKKSDTQMPVPLAAHGCQKQCAVNGALSLTHCNNATFDHQHFSQLDDDNDYDEYEDETGSDESSGTSTQKDGKYCECWHCEFFGHSAPPTVPTSKNYPEMRERLRLRLKKKNEQKSEAQVPGTDIANSCKHHQKEAVCSISPSVATSRSNVIDPQVADVDELLKFINGSDGEKMTKSSRKSAKRARQKQRKAAEKDREDVKSTTCQPPTALAVCAHHSNGHQGQSPSKNFDNKMEVKKSSASFVVTNSSGCTSSSYSGSKADANKENLRSLINGSKKGISTKPEGKPGTVDTTKTVHTVNGIADSDVSNIYLAAHSKGNNSSGKNARCAKKTEVLKSDRGEMHGNLEASRNCETVADDPFLRNDVCPVESNATEVRICSAVQNGNAAKPANGHSLPKSSRTKTQPQHLAEPISQPNSFLTDVFSDIRLTSGVMNKQPKQKNHTSVTSAVSSMSGARAPSQNPGKKGSVKSLDGTDNKTVIPSANGCDTSQVDAGCMSNGHAINSQKRSAVAKVEGNSKDMVTVCADSYVKHAVVESPRKGSHVSLNGATPVSNAAACSRIQNGFITSGSTRLPESASSSSHAARDIAVGRYPENFPDLVPTSQQLAKQSNGDVGNGKNKKKCRKGKGKDGLTAVDEIFLPKDSAESGRLDDFEREIEEFKRFCFNSTPADNREKLQVSMNMKDIFTKKKAASNGLV